MAVEKDKCVSLARTELCFWPLCGDAKIKKKRCLTRQCNLLGWLKWGNYHVYICSRVEAIENCEVMGRPVATYGRLNTFAARLPICGSRTRHTTLVSGANTTQRACVDFVEFNFHLRINRYRNKYFILSSSTCSTPTLVHKLYVR